MLKRPDTNSTDGAGAQAPSIAEQLSRLFAGNETGHHTFEALIVIDGRFKGDGVDFINGPPTTAEWDAHLLGTTGLGVTPVLKDGMLYFSCIDLDKHGPRAISFSPSDVVRKIKRRKLPLIPVLSKNDDLHLFTFYKEKVTAIAARGILATWTKALGYPDVEIFPAQDIPNKDGHGSNLWMPYFGCFADNVELPRQAMVDEHRTIFSVEDFIKEAFSKAITAEELYELKIRSPGRPRNEEKSKEKKAKARARKGSRYGTQGWVQSKLEEAKEELRHCGPGNHDAPVFHFFYIGRIVGAGLLDDEKTWDALTEAMREGSPNDEMREKADRRYKDGKSQPLDYRAKRDAPIIRLEPNLVADTVDQIEQALVQGNTNLYQRGAKIVYPCFIKGKSHNGEETRTPGVDPVGLNRLYEFADSVAVYEKWSNTADDFIVCNAPRDLVAVLRERTGDLRFPVLRATVNTPLVFPDGRILDQPGYDAASGLLYDPLDVVFPAIPHQPTKQDAIDALKVINEPLVHYKFRDDGDTEQTPESERGRVSRSVAWSLMITGLVRPALDLAPGHGISASVIGSGKGKLVEAASILMVGDKPRTITQGKDEEEFEKRLVAEVRVNTGLISISNCRYPVQGVFIEEFLTNKRINPRILGLSENITVDNTNLMVWNGNNLQILGDTVRRFVRLYIAPDVEFAYYQKYPFDPVEYVQEHRVRIVVAVMTLLRAYVLAEDKPELSAFQNFGLWSSFVRGAIVWAGGADPVLSQSEIVQEDEGRLELARVMAGWEQAMGTEDFHRLKKVAEEAGAWGEWLEEDREQTRKWPEFFDAMEDIKVLDAHNKISPKKLGQWLKKQENTIVDGKKFVKMFNTHRKDWDWALKNAGKSGK